jgi:hypothetical protein
MDALLAAPQCLLLCTYKTQPIVALYDPQFVKIQITRRVHNSVSYCGMSVVVLNLADCTVTWLSPRRS